MAEETINKIKSFKDLKIWQKGIQLVEDVYVLSKTFPKKEIYGLQSQLRRSAVSIPSNIAEGFARIHNKEYRNFIYRSWKLCRTNDTNYYRITTKIYCKDQKQKQYYQTSR